MSAVFQRVIRPGRAEDASAIADLFIAARRVCMPYVPELHTEAETRRFISENVMQTCEVWVCDADREVAGFFAMRGDHLDHLYVAPTFQNCGIGGELLQKAMEQRPGGFTLWVFQQNAPARRFYEAHGLKVVKLTDGQDNEEKLPDALYTWRGSAEMEEAVCILRAGGLVAFPTETVYGLGADATSDSAVRRIFAAKGRPATNPVIAHVADIESAKRYTTHWTDAAQQLAAAFWPGPLTLVLPKRDNIPDVVTASRGTVGLRVPNHPLALQLLRAFDGVIAAPSANRSNRVSPTTAQHVRDELGDAVDLILDGGSCSVGIESTVLDLSGAVPRILRPGMVTRRQIESVVGPVELGNGVTEVSSPAASPGQHAVHYAPTTPTYRFPSSQRCQLATESPDGRPNGLIVLGTTPAPMSQRGAIITMPPDPELYARSLYEALRTLDALQLAALFVEMPPETPEWLAVRDRLLRATLPMGSL